MSFNPSASTMKYVDFARFCTNNHLDPYDVAELITLAERAFKAGERYCNTGSDRNSKSEQRTGELFEEKAASLGYEVRWPGLWPELLKEDREIYLPTFKD